jgi:hypothetical protein
MKKMRRLSPVILMFLLSAATGCCRQSERRVASAKSIANADAHIVFTGICTFLRRPSAPVIAYIPRVTAHTSDYDPNDATKNIPEHTPFIVVDETKYRFATSTLTAQHVANQYAVFWLDDGDLELLDAMGDPITWAETDSKDECPTTAPGDMNTVPHIGSFCDATGRPAIDDPNVRVQMRRGTTAAYVLAKHSSEFKTKGGGAVDYPRRLAGIVDWAVPINGNALVFTVASIKGGGAHTHMLSVFPDSKGQVVVGMGSGAKADVIAALNRTGAPMDPDTHFEVYYDRCTKKTGKPIPHKLRQCPPDKLPPWIPDWMQQHGAIPGSVNCGPDQWP